MTKQLILSGGVDVFPLCGAMKFADEVPNPPLQVSDAVKKGILLGSKLGRKLQIRNESNNSKSIRRKHGKINKRLIHSAAYDAQDLFYRINVDTKSIANLHITVDASSSMGGIKWDQTMTAVVAICKAASMVDNIHVTISFRSTHSVSGNILPYVVLAYDSAVDKFSKVKNLFPYLCPHGWTPEGLAFSAISDLFQNISPDEEDRYFLNLSDGEPCFSIHDAASGVNISYAGDVGCNHTKGQVDKIRNNDINILSYFITYDSSKSVPGSDDILRKNFKKMYGPSAEFMDVNSIVSLAKTMNRLFLKGYEHK